VFIALLNDLLLNIFYAAGLAEQWRRMYSSAEWLNGKTCATLLATIGGENAAPVVCTERTCCSSI
jgi:hypothetical protein